MDREEMDQYRDYRHGCFNHDHHPAVPALIVVKAR